MKLLLTGLFRTRYSLFFVVLILALSDAHIEKKISWWQSFLAIVIASVIDFFLNQKFLKEEK